MKKNKIALLINVTLASTAAFNGVAHANDDSAESIERVEVTGSRLNRADMESALPVTVISSEAIVASGLTDISDVLADLPFNTTGSVISDGGSSAANHAGSGMRGLGSSRTLVLVNGRRIAPSATYGGSAANLNLIPVDAVARLEILRDGASAIYGSDAIGGVYNIILKKEYDGLALKVNASNTSDGGYGKRGATLMFGTATDTASSMTVVELQKQDPVKDGQRPHISTNRETSYRMSSLYAPEGTYRPVEEAGKNDYTGDYVPGKDCPAEWIVPDSKGLGFRCGYANTKGKDYLPERTKVSIFNYSKMDISDQLSVNSQMLILNDRSSTESSSLWTDELYMDHDNPLNPTFGTENASDIRVYHRLADVADRRAKFDSLVLDMNLGLSYELESGVFDVSFTHSRQDVDVQTNHYAFKGNLQNAVNEGRYNPFVRGGNADAATIASIRHTATREAYSRMNIANIAWSSELPIELDGGTVAYSIGAETSKQVLFDARDAQQQAGLVQGAYGGDTGGERDYRAVFTEFSIPVTEDIVINAASRYDEYDLPDVGQLSSSINIRYEFSDKLVLRGSYSEGFRAPDIDDLLSDKAESYNRVFDRTTCGSTCEREQVLRVSGGDLTLKPESSQQIGFGLVADPFENFSITLDYYHISMDDQIQFIDAQDVVNLEAYGLLDQFKDKLYVKRDAEGEIEEVGSGNINMEGYLSEGIDWEINYKLVTQDIGDFGFKFSGSYVLEYSEKKTPTSDRYNHVGYEDVPEYRLIFNTNYSYDAFYVGLTYNYMASFYGEDAEEEFERQSAGGEKTVEDFGAFAQLNLVTSYNIENYGKVVLGARNILNEYPDVNESLRHGYNADLHNIRGREIYANYQVSF